MKFLITLLLFFITKIIAQTNQEQVEFLTRVVSDIANNGDEYIQYFRTGNQPINLRLIRSAQQITQSIEDGDSYTTLAANLAFMSDLSAMITPLPWFNQRIATGNLSLIAIETSINLNESSSSSAAAASVNDVNKIGVTYVGLSVFGGLMLAIL